MYDITTTSGPTQDASPFDQIKRVRDDGTEYWSARDLQPFMGYSKWQDFQSAIERAKVAAANAGHDAELLFVQVSQVMDAGNLGPQQRIDYELPRFACYLTFLNGDPRKPEVAAAQAYFAIKTREAETTPARALTEDEIVHQALTITTRKVEELTARVQELEPAAQAWGTLAAVGDGVLISRAGHILSEQYDTSARRIFKQMHALGLIFKRGHASWQAYQPAIDKGYMIERLGRQFQKPNGELCVSDPQSLVTPKGMDFLREKLPARTPSLIAVPS